MMELLVKDYEESICSVEKLFGKFTETMLAHSVDPVLTFKENLVKALDKASTSVLAGAVANVADSNRCRCNPKVPSSIPAGGKDFP